MKPQEINIDDFSYNLPSERIAQHPVSQRDNSKLLIASKEISKDRFSNLADYLPQGALMVFNDTKVFHARMVFRKITGAKIEVFLLEPLSPTIETEQAFQQKSGVIWKCLVGNLKKWKEGKLFANFILKEKDIRIEITHKGSEGNSQFIEFKWDNPDILFGEIVEKAGAIPLPPYMNRPAEEEDSKRYQTIYARQEGSVAAPTAGLHFTKKVLHSLAAKGIKTDYVTLDVGAGTFKPVKASRMADHQMHTEKVYISFETIEQLLEAIEHRKIISVGTTTTRTLESIYWFAMKLKTNTKAVFEIHQWDPYQYTKEELLFPKHALELVKNHMIKNDISLLKGQTQLIIAPGYNFKFVNLLITNFHQPKSTLLLLVAAFYGNRWKDAYQFAKKTEETEIAWQEAMKSSHVDHISISTDEDYIPKLASFFKKRARRIKR